MPPSSRASSEATVRGTVRAVLVGIMHGIAGVTLACTPQLVTEPIPTTIVHIPHPPEQTVKPGGQRQTLPQSYHNVACSNRNVDVLASLNPTSPYDYGEIRIVRAGKAEFEVASRYGVRCADAKHPARCQEWYQIQDADAGFALASDATSYRYLVFTGGDHAWQVNSNSDLLEFLGPIDTPNEALLLAWLDGYELPPCGELGSTLTPVSGGYLFYSPASASSCEQGFNRTRLRVDRNGTVTPLGDVFDPRRPSCD